MIDLYEYQLDAIDKLRNGSILCGDVGTGKSRTALAYFFLKICGGSISANKLPMKMNSPKSLFIITTAKKRDSAEWLEELSVFRLDKNPEVQVTIDSWNNIKKYKDVVGAFFIFDEQRVVGSGAWVKAFLNITRKNHWILLSATPGDVWMDYVPVFIANGYYKNKTEFVKRHVIYSPYTKFPKIDKYIDTGHLLKLKSLVLVRMRNEKISHANKNVVFVEYDKKLYDTVWKDRWDPYDNLPIKESGKLCYLLRRVVNTDPSRIEAFENLIVTIPRTIVFYNFTYEVDILRSICEACNIPYAEWNGQRHLNIPDTERWVYLVQYNAGSEGWNCIKTDSIIFYSQSYSYRMTKQAAGRIDRVNTPYKELYYYYIRSHAPIDEAINRSLQNKRNFNERHYLSLF